MKCAKHATEEAVGTCAKCGAGLCNDCFHRSEYQFDGKPCCRSCNLATMRELLSQATKELIGSSFRAAINAVLIVVGIFAYLKSHDTANLIFWCGLGGFPSAWRAMRMTLVDKIRIGVEQAGGDWSGGIIFFVVRLVLAFIFGCIVSPVLMCWSGFRAWKAWLDVKKMRGEIESFRED